MDKDTLIQIVGQNPLNDQNQLTGYQELLGLSGHKPFECVGEFQESQWALKTISKQPGWQNDFVVKSLSPSISAVSEYLIFTPSPTHLIPQEFQDVLDKFK